MANFDFPASWRFCALVEIMMSWKASTQSIEVLYAAEVAFGVTQGCLPELGGLALCLTWGCDLGQCAMTSHGLGCQGTIENPSKRLIRETTLDKP